MRLEDLKEQMQDCTKCGLCEYRTKIVFGNGNSKPKIMLVGEAPGPEDDREGIPLVGEIGEKLDSILKYVGTSREEVYVTNTVLCPPPQHRFPRTEEMEACRWRLIEEINILKPDVIVALGRAALQQLNGKPVKGALNGFFPDKIDGDWIKYKTDQHECLLMVTYHPNYHLRSPNKAYKVTLSHWTQLKKWLNEHQ